MKLAKDCCAGDGGHRKWILRKFGKVNRNTSKIHYLYDKNKKQQTKFAAAFKIKRKRKFSLTCDGKFFPPKPCPQYRECENIIPLTWISCEDKPPLHIVVNENPSLLVQMKKRLVHKVKFCQTDKKLCLIFLMIYLCSKYNSQHFIMNCYQTKSNYEFLSEVGTHELRLRMRGAKQESTAMTICGINLELPIDCDYINLPKHKLTMAQALIMYPAVEDFFIENNNIISEKTKSLLKNLNACYMHVIKNTGFFSSLSTDYLISQLLYFRGKYKLGNKFSADFEDFVTENSAIKVTDDLTKLSNDIFDAGKNVTIPTQPSVFIDGNTAIQLLPVGKTKENLQVMKKDIRLTLLTKDEEELERLLPEIRPRIQIALRQLSVIINKFKVNEKITPEKYNNITNNFKRNISIIDEQLKKLNGKQTSETKIFENKKTECIEQFEVKQKEYDHKNELVNLKKIKNNVENLNIDEILSKINTENILIYTETISGLINAVTENLENLKSSQTIFKEEEMKVRDYCEEKLLRLNSLLSSIEEKEKEEEEQKEEILQEQEKIEKEDLLIIQNIEKEEEIININEEYTEKLNYFYNIENSEQKDFLIKSIENINIEIAYYENNKNNDFSAEGINEIKKVLLSYQQEFMSIQIIITKLDEYQVFLDKIEKEIKNYSQSNAVIEDFTDSLTVGSVVQIYNQTINDINDFNLKNIKDTDEELKNKLNSLNEFLNQNSKNILIEKEKDNLVQNFKENIEVFTKLILIYEEFLKKRDFLHELSIKIEKLNEYLINFSNYLKQIYNSLELENYKNIKDLIVQLNLNKKNVLSLLSTIIINNEDSEKIEFDNTKEYFLNLSLLLEFVEKHIDIIQQDNEIEKNVCEQGGSLIIIFSDNTNTPVYDFNYFIKYKENINEHREEKDNKIKEYENKIEEIEEIKEILNEEIKEILNSGNTPTNIDVGIIININNEIKKNLEFLEEKYNNIIKAYEFFFKMYDGIYTTDNIQESLNKKPLNTNIATFNTLKDSLGRSARMIPSIEGSTTIQSTRRRQNTQKGILSGLFAPNENFEQKKANENFEQEKAKYLEIESSIKKLLVYGNNNNIPEINTKINEAEVQTNLIKNNFLDEYNNDNDIKNSDLNIQIFKEKLEKIKTNLILNKHNIKFSDNIDAFEIIVIPANPYTNISFNESCPMKILEIKLNSCTDEMWKGNSNNGFFDSFLFATFATDEVSKIFIPILYKIRNKYKPLYDAFVGYLNLHNESNHNNYSICKQKYINIIYNCLHEISVQYKNDNTHFYNNTLFNCLQQNYLTNEENMSTSNYQCLFFFFELANFELKGEKNFYYHYTLTNTKNILKEKEEDCECIASIVLEEDLTFLLNNDFDTIESMYVSDTSFFLYSIIVQNETSVAAFSQALCNTTSDKAEYNYFYYNNDEHIPKIKIDSNTKLGDKFQFTSATLIFSKLPDEVSDVD